MMQNTHENKCVNLDLRAAAMRILCSYTTVNPGSTYTYTASSTWVWTLHTGVWRWSNLPDVIQFLSYVNTIIARKPDYCIIKPHQSKLTSMCCRSPICDLREKDLLLRIPASSFSSYRSGQNRSILHRRDKTIDFHTGQEGELNKRKLVCQTNMMLSFICDIMVKCIYHTGAEGLHQCLVDRWSHSVLQGGHQRRWVEWTVSVTGKSINNWMLIMSDNSAAPKVIYIFKMSASVGVEESLGRG